MLVLAILCFFPSDGTIGEEFLPKVTGKTKEYHIAFSLICNVTKTKDRITMNFEIPYYTHPIFSNSTTIQCCSEEILDHLQVKIEAVESIIFYWKYGWKYLSIKGKDFEKTFEVKKNELHRDMITAIKNGNVMEVERLAAKGVDVNFQDIFGWTPLMHAASVSDFAMFQLLIDNGADVNFENEFGENLHFAASSSSDKYIIQYLIIKKIPLKHYNYIHISAVFAYFENCNAEILPYVNLKEYLSATSIHGEKLIHFAAICGNKELLKNCINAEFLLTETNGFGQTPQDLCQIYHKKSVEALLAE